MKISQVVWMMIFTVFVGLSTPGVVAAQGRGGGPTKLNCSGCVGTTDIEDGAVTSAKVADGSITGTDIQDGSVGSSDIAAGAVGSAQINSAQVQTRVTGTCAAGSSIRSIGQSGTVLCETDDGGVTAVTASAPLVSSGGSTPNISLPGVIIGLSNTANTAVGTSALQNTTGRTNTAIGVQALQNTTGFFNTASGVDALGNSTSGLFNTASGVSALGNSTSGSANTASGYFALLNNATGNNNTASGAGALLGNTTGNFNTAIGQGADVAAVDLTNATAIGSGAIVNASNKIRLGNTAVSVIEAQVGITTTSDANQKENLRPVDGEAVLNKIQGLNLTSWNFIGQDPAQFRHYGPVAQEFFAAFGSDGLGTIGTPTTITSTDMEGILMIAVQALEKRTVGQRQEVETLKTENAALKARLEALETLIREVLPHR